LLSNSLLPIFARKSKYFAAEKQIDRREKGCPFCIKMPLYLNEAEAPK